MTDTKAPYAIVGIDVSKDKLDIHILLDNKSLEVNNDIKAITCFVKRLKKSYQQPLIVMENTGGLEKYMVKVCHEQNISVHIAHSNRVYHFSKQKGYFAKTDIKDAITLSQYGEQEKVKPNSYPHKEGDALRELSNRRSQIVDDLHAEKCRLSRPINSQVKRSIERKIKFLHNEKELIERQINQIIEKNATMLEKSKRLQTFKGVGPAISQGIVCLLPELGTLGRSQISALIGVAPKNNDSGKKIGRRRIMGGRWNARRLLYMGALVACKFNPCLKEMYQKLINKGKPAKVAIVAVMRKMIITLNAMIRDSKDWMPSYR